VTSIVEDIAEQACSIGFYNFQVSETIDPNTWIPKGTYLVVKEPWMKLDIGGKTFLRVDSPSDVVFLHESDELLKGTSWYKPLNQTFEECKAAANKYFGQGQLEKALQFYDLAHRLKPNDPVIHLNKAAAFLRLGRFFDAYEATQSALADDQSIVNLDEGLKVKAQFRLGQAAYGLRDWVTAVDAFSEVPPATRGTLLEQSQSRLEESRFGRYNMSELASTFSRCLKLDVADYVGPVVITDIPGKGKGLRMTSDVPEGTLLLASKALAISEFMPSDPPILVVDRKRKVPLSGSFYRLIGEVIRVLRDNPQRTNEVYGLDSGKFPRIPIAAGLIDTARIEEICQINQFEILNRFAFMGFDEESTYPDGLWVLPSFINHSCAPNSFHTSFGDLMMIRAMRDLREGEEVTIAYGKRGKELEERWNFRCDCEWCTEERTTPKQKLRRRTTLSQRPEAFSPFGTSATIAPIVRELEATYRSGDRFKEHLSRPLTGLMGAYMREDNVADVIRIGRRLLGSEVPTTPAIEFTVWMTMTRAYFDVDEVKAKETLKEMDDWLLKRTGLTVDPLKPHLNELLAEMDGDAFRTDLLFSLRDCEED
jgi:hypothetical protein